MWARTLEPRAVPHGVQEQVASRVAYVLIVEPLLPVHSDPRVADSLWVVEVRQAHQQPDSECYDDVAWLRPITTILYGIAAVSY